VKRPQTEINKDEELFSHMQHVLRYHELMLGDAVRNRAFYRALRRCLKPNSNVLDIGSGTGIWAIAAAKLGAQKVVAIEKEKLLLPIIEKLVRCNGVEDRVEVREGDSRKIELPKKFDLVISETIGNEAFDEAIVPIMLDARKRFLKKGGALIPKRIRSVLAPAKFDRDFETLPAGMPLNFRYVEALNFDIPKRVHNLKNLQLLGAPRTLVSVDLATVQDVPSLEGLTANWKVKDASQVNCLVLWAEAELTDGVKLRTIDSRNWTPIAFPLEPLNAGPAKIDCVFTLTDRQYYWSLSVEQKNKKQTQSHSPVFPFTSLKARL
jgi:protein arginine N-methyltransferase 1